MRKEYDFSKDKPVKDFPQLARFQEEMKGKTRVSIMLDNYVIEANERPGLANHEPQPTAERFLDMLFPQTATTRIEKHANS